jgi:hypothetical protein
LEYFSNRLYSDAWDNAPFEAKRRALIAASRIIDTMNYKGEKAAVAALLAADPKANQTAIYASEASQYHEFPRGTDTTVPSAIEQATYEISYALLDGRDPDLELESLGISSQGIDSVRTTYSRNQVPIEHIVNGVPSHLAWRLLRPFLRDEDQIKLIRI